MVGCSHGDVDGDGGGGGCCYDGDGYGLRSELPSSLPPPHPPPPPPCPRADACGEVSGYNPCWTVHPCRRMFGCAGCGCGAPSDGGGGDGGGCAGVFSVHSLVAALPPLFGSHQPSAPEPGLKGVPVLHGSHGNPSSWVLLTSCFSAHPGTKKAT